MISDMLVRAGQAFADCELWHEPPMLMLQPNIAKSMRAFRYNGLAHALANAKRYGKCTLFPPSSLANDAAAQRIRCSAGWN